VPKRRGRHHAGTAPETARKPALLTRAWRGVGGNAASRSYRYDGDRGNLTRLAYLDRWFLHDPYRVANVNPVVRGRLVLGTTLRWARPSRRLATAPSNPLIASGRRGTRWGRRSRIESLRALRRPHPGPAPGARFHPRDVVAQEAQDSAPTGAGGPGAPDPAPHARQLSLLDPTPPRGSRRRERCEK
jgi:hypothetical protein